MDTRWDDSQFGSGWWAFRWDVLTEGVGAAEAMKESCCPIVPMALLAVKVGCYPHVRRFHAGIVVGDGSVCDLLA